jgi:hypothetical protein
MLRQMCISMHVLKGPHSHFTGAGRQYPTTDTRLIGLCTGWLTAAAISCSQSITDLIPLAVHTVLVAFRTGLLVAEVRDRIEAPRGSPETWSVLAPGLKPYDAVPIVHRFNKDKVYSTIMLLGI